MRQRLLVSIRGKKEALSAYRGGAHIIDVEYPASALGTPYPLNIKTVRSTIPKKIPIATNIGEEQGIRSSSCQAALGVALAGADIIKAGLANYDFKEAEYLCKSIVRTIKTWFPKKQVIPAVFADKEFVRKFNPTKEGPKLAKAIRADGLLIDTFYKERGKKLLDLMSIKQIGNFVKACHQEKIEAWIAGSITQQQLPELWALGVDVICVRGAASEVSDPNDRFGAITKKKVTQLRAAMNYI